MRCYRCNERMKPGEGKKVNKTIAGSWIYICGSCAHDDLMKDALEKD
jgi:predicted SprT family Zn-dependent metalloprotease